MVTKSATPIKLNEIFESVQGEGIYSGQLMTFIRFQKCPFRCTWCDTKDSWPSTTLSTRELTPLQILGEIASPTTIPWICITGGEPLAQVNGFRGLVLTLRAVGFNIEVETSGLLPLPAFWVNTDVFQMVDSWVVDIKCPASGESEKNVYKNLDILRSTDQVKFVINDFEDYSFARDVLRNHKSLKATTLISPVWNSPLATPEMVVDWMKKFPLPTNNARLSLQLHKIIWGEVRGV